VIGNGDMRVTLRRAESESMVAEELEATANENVSSRPKWNEGRDPVDERLTTGSLADARDDARYSSGLRTQDLK